MKIKETFYKWKYSDKKIRSWRVLEYCCNEFEEFIGQYHMFKDLNDDNSISMSDVDERIDNFRYCPYCGEKIELIE